MSALCNRQIFGWSREMHYLVTQIRREFLTSVVLVESCLVTTVILGGEMLAECVDTA